MDLFSPNIAYASGNFESFLTNVNKLIVNPLIGLLFALAIVYFLYGVMEFVGNAENEEARTTGKSHMVWGIIGIAIMLGVWGILNIVINTFNINSSGNINPQENKVQLNPYNPTVIPQ